MYCKVYVKCGHVGINNCIKIWLPIEAENKKDAAEIARYAPRVKHHHKDAIIDVKVISKKEFDDLITINKADPYLNCHSKQEQNKIIDLYERIEEDYYNTSKKENPIQHEYTIYKNRMVRNVRKYSKYNNYFYNEEEYLYVN